MIKAPVIPLHAEKAKFPMELIEFGMNRLVNPVQFEKA